MKIETHDLVKTYGERTVVNHVNVTVEQGESKKSVVVNNTVEVVNAMSIMYMTTVVK